VADPVIDDTTANTSTSATSKTAEKERLPVILEPPLFLSGSESRRGSAPLFRELRPSRADGSATERTAQTRTPTAASLNVDEVHRTGTGVVGTTAESQLMADDDFPDDDEEWSWKYDEHGNKVWYRRSRAGGFHDVPEGRAGTVRFATRPVATPPTTTPRPHGYWMADDRGSYLWYRFVEKGQYVRDPSVETISEESRSPDEAPGPHEKLTWTGVGR